MDIKPSNKAITAIVLTLDKGHALFFSRLVLEKAFGIRTVAHQLDETQIYNQAEQLVNEHQADLVFINTLHLESAESVAKRIRTLSPNIYIIAYVIYQTPKQEQAKSIDFVCYIPLLRESLNPAMEEFVSRLG